MTGPGPRRRRGRRGAWPDGADAPEPGRLGDALDRVLAGLGAPKATALAALYDSWPEVVGEAAAAHARPLALRAGTLVIGVDDPALATELRYRRGELVTRLAAVLGPGAVGGVEIRVEPAREP